MIEPTELTFIFADGDEGQRLSMNEIVNRFNEAYPDITVKIQPGNGGAYSEFLKTKESVREFPDVMEMEILRSMCVPICWNRCRKISFLYLKRQLHLMARRIRLLWVVRIHRELFIIRSILMRMGSTEPKTYDEFMELCQKIRDKGDMAPLVIGGQDIWHVGFWFYKAYNDQVMSQDIDFIKHCYEGTKDFSDPAIMATFEEMKKHLPVCPGWLGISPDAQITTFLVSDMAAMMYSGTHMFSQITDADPNFEMGWFAVPSPDGKTRLVGGGGGRPGNLRRIRKDPNKKAAAEEFIRFFYTPDNYKVYCDKLNANSVYC